ncbi:MAG TPA: thiamine-phosphate kinase [Alphaproteobacteria bacterium]|nr:thiamine-phosphate kinase [Alphaproteobacteria bacterium]
MTGEFARIDRFFKPLARGFPGALGLANDGAVLAAPPGQEIVVTTDAMVAGIHFLADDPPADIAAKLLRVNLSDLAAMGAAPLAYTLVTAIPASRDEAWLEAFAAALAADQAAFGIHLCGGDSVRVEGPDVLTVAAYGLVPAGRSLPRSGARPGDALYVSGTVGDAGLGYACLQGGLQAPAEDRAALIGRLRRPTPRLALGRALVGLATAALDVSDGLAADAGHIAAESGVGLEIEAERLPLSPAARRALAADPALLPRIVGFGDDYEICFTAPPGLGPEIAGTPIAEIGRVVAGSGVRIFRDGRPVALDRAGWTHF